MILALGIITITWLVVGYWIAYQSKFSDLIAVEVPNVARAAGVRVTLVLLWPIVFGLAFLLPPSNGGGPRIS